MIFASKFANNILSYEKNIFFDSFLLDKEDNIKKCELFNFKGKIHWFNHNSELLGIDDTNQYIYYNPRLCEGFSNSFSTKFMNFEDNKKIISSYIEIINGDLIKEEIIEISENIEDKLINFISYKFSFDESKKIFLNSKFLIDSFSIKIREKIKEISKLKIFIGSDDDRHLNDSYKRINDVIEIIKFNIKRSDFINALRSLRTLKNSILELIYDDYFIKKFDVLTRLLSKLEQEKSIYEYIDIKELKEEKKKIIENIEKKIKNNIQEIYKDKEEKDFNYYIYLAIEFVSIKEKYFSTPIYFSSIKFEDLFINHYSPKKEPESSTLKRIKNLIINYYSLEDEDIKIIKKEVKKNYNSINFVKNKILIFENKKKLLNFCIKITNNAIHKNNFDSENYEN
jgi:hypothetical protein